MATRTEKLTKTGKQVAKSTGKVASRVFAFVGGAASDVKRGVDRAVARRRRRQKLAKAGEVLKSVGKAAVVATAVAAAVVGAREVNARKKGRG
jgi:hypothetical protein